MIVIGLIIFIAPILIPGIILVREGSKYKKLGIKFQKYYTIVYVTEEDYLDNIAAALNVSYDEVYRDLQELISKGTFIGCYIDSNSRRIVFQDKILNNGRTINTKDLNTSEQRTITCKSCGGINLIGSKECEYCGTSM